MKIPIQNIKKSYSYTEYKALVDDLIENKSTTGNELTEEKIEFTILNRHRVKRLDKTIALNKSLVIELSKISKPLQIFIITESWCGDAAQQIPWFAKLNEINSNIKINLVLRDENPAFMDNYLTNGSKSIPVVIFGNSNNDQLYKWGPRPKVLQDLISKISKTEITKEEKLNQIHTWYNKNKGEALQEELISILTQPQN